MVTLISVIIPTYNREDTILDAVNSILAQTYQNFEIIIVDDGSTDKTEQIIKSLNDPRIKYIYQENSGRPSCARNKGIKNASGEYIAFLDSDDLWHPQMLEKNINVINKNNAGIITCWSAYKNFEGQELYKRICFAKNNDEYILYLLLQPDKAFTGTPTLFVKKECFDKVGYFDEEMTFCEDWDMFFRIALAYEFYNIEEILTYVRVHQKSFSKTPEVVKFRSGYLRFLKKAFNNENLPNKFLNIKNKAYSNALWCIGGWALYRTKDYPIARESLIQCFKYSYSRIFKMKFIIALILSYSPSNFLYLYENLRRSLKKLLGRKY